MGFEDSSPRFVSGEAEDILHIVKPGVAMGGGPLGGAEGALGEGVPTGGLVG